MGVSSTYERGKIPFPLNVGYLRPSKEILKQIHQLFNEDYYRKEDEFIISNPLKLEWHFPQEFIVMAAVKYQYHIIWQTKDGMTDTMIHWQMPITVTPQLRKESLQVNRPLYSSMCHSASNTKLRKMSRHKLRSNVRLELFRRLRSHNP